MSAHRTHNVTSSDHFTVSEVERCQLPYLVIRFEMGRPQFPHLIILLRWGYLTSRTSSFVMRESDPLWVAEDTQSSNLSPQKESSPPSHDGHTMTSVRPQFTEITIWPSLMYSWFLRWRGASSRISVFHLRWGDVNSRTPSFVAMVRVIP